LLGASLLLPAGQALGADETGGFYPGDLGQAIAAVVIFVLLLVILGRWAWRPLVAQLQRREESIADALKRAEQREKETQRLLEEHRARMEAVEGDAEQLLVKARREALEARGQVLTAAEEESRKLLDSAREEINQAKRAALRELRASAAELAADLAAAVIGRTLTPEDHARLLNESLAEISRRGGEGKS
jgi:F-type H+-transporting ATPase subunit b